MDKTIDTICIALRRYQNIQVGMYCIIEASEYTSNVIFILNHIFNSSAMLYINHIWQALHIHVFNILFDIIFY